MKLFREGRHFGQISLTCLIFYLALTDDFLVLYLVSSSNICSHTTALNQFLKEKTFSELELSQRDSKCLNVHSIWLSSGFASHTHSLRGFQPVHSHRSGIFSSCLENWITVDGLQQIQGLHPKTSVCLPTKDKRAGMTLFNTSYIYVLFFAHSHPVLSETTKPGISDVKSCVMSPRSLL